MSSAPNTVTVLGDADAAASPTLEMIGTAKSVAIKVTADAAAQLLRAPRFSNM